MLERARNLRVQGHRCGNDAYAQKAGDRGIRELLHENAKDLIWFVQVGRDDRHAFDGGHCRPHAEQHARRPDEHDEQRMENDHGAKCLHVLGGHPMLKEMREHADGKRHEHIRKELHLADRMRALAADEQIGMLLGNQRRSGRRAAQLADDQEQDHAAQQDQHGGMHGVCDRKASHAAAEDIGQNRDTDHRRTDPGRNAAACCRAIGGKERRKGPRRDASESCCPSPRC